MLTMQKYKDDDGDLVSLSSSAELSEAFRIASNANSKILYLNLYYNEKNNNILNDQNESLQKLSEEFTNVLENFSKLTLKEICESNETMETEELSKEVAAQVFKKINFDALNSCPQKAQYRYNLDLDNSNKQATYSDRQAAFKKLTYNPNAPPVVSNPTPVVTQPAPRRKKKTVFRKSCRDCGEPLEEENGLEICRSLKCFNSPYK